MRRSSFPPRHAYLTTRACHLDRAGIPPARPVSSADIGDEEGGHLQSDGDFAIAERIIARTTAFTRRSDRILTNIGFVIAGAGLIWLALPAICMALAGGTPS